MSNYSASNTLGGTQQAISTAYKTLLSLTAATATLCNARVFDVIFSTDGTPADNVMTYDISRQTAAGTSTAVTPTALDGQHRAAGTVGSANFTAEGTITGASSVFSCGANQRQTVRWLANPGGELVIPATNLAGFALRAKSPAYTSTAIATAWFME